MWRGLLPGSDRAQQEQTARLVLRHLSITLGAAFVLATVFTAWTPASLNPSDLVGQLLLGIEQEPGAGQPSAVNLPALFGPQSSVVGIVAGHSGIHPDSGLQDPGAVCPDGLTEAEVNREIAELVVRGLEGAGIEADLLDEWDERLGGYRAAALVSVHADACVWINEDATGYKVAAAPDSPTPERAARLVACLEDRYGRTTGLRFHPGSITRDMTEYHSFYEIHGQTPAAIIETGFLYLDREFLTSQPDQAANGIVDGILCYLNNEPIDLDPAQAQP
jgi:N-acetylmuramoyl-L-alanine amidase